MENISTSNKKCRGRPKVKRSETRRADIVEAAYRSFIELGFKATTTSAIAALARVSKQSIYTFFPRKSELFAAVIVEHYQLRLDLPRPPEEKLPLLDVILKIFRADMDDEGFRERDFVLRLILWEAINSPEMGPYIHQHGYLPARAALIDWVDLQRQMGLLTVNDTTSFADMLMDIGFGPIVPGRREDADIDGAEIGSHLKQSFSIALKGAS